MLLESELQIFEILNMCVNITNKYFNVRIYLLNNSQAFNALITFIWVGFILNFNSSIVILIETVIASVLSSNFN